MNKLTLIKSRAMVCLSLTCLFLVPACRKDLLQPNSDDKIEKARIWYTKQFDKSTSTLVSGKGRYSFSLTVKPKWDVAQFAKLEDQTEAYIVPLDINVPLELSPTVNPILIMRKKDSGYDLKIIDNDPVANKNNESTTFNAKSLYQRAFGNDQRKVSPGVNKIDLGTSESHSPSQNKIMAATPVVSSDNCIDWYLVTRDGDGVIITEEFVGRTCGIDEMEGGGGGGNTVGGNVTPIDFGLNPDCLNCQIADNQFEAFLNYLKSLNLQTSDPFGTTVTLGSNSYHGVMVQIYNQSGALIGSFFTPDANFNMFTRGIHYSIGFRGPDGNNPSPTYGYGITGFTFPTTYYNGKTNPFPMMPGSVRYTPPGYNLANILGVYDNESKAFLNSHPDITYAFETYLNNNGRTPENIDFLKWGIGYLMEHPNFVEFRNQFLVTSDTIADPNGDSWTDPDDEVIPDADQTTYQQYQNTDLWPTIERVIPFEKFVPNRIDASGHDINCLVLAKEQLGKVGYTCSGYLPGSQTFQTYQESTGVDLDVTKKAISYIISSLQKKIPVLIGVDNRVGTSSVKNDDKSTDHFVVIVAMGTDDKGKYLQFMDSSTMIPSTGASFSNRLYYNLSTGKITGRTANIRYRSFPGMHDYIVTQVRKSIKK